jgi:hypothetical protein
MYRGTAESVGQAAEYVRDKAGSAKEEIVVLHSPVLYAYCYLGSKYSEPGLSLKMKVMFFLCDILK